MYQRDLERNKMADIDRGGFKWLLGSRFNRSFYDRVTRNEEEERALQNTRRNILAKLAQRINRQPMAEQGVVTK